MIHQVRKQMATINTPKKTPNAKTENTKCPPTARSSPPTAPQPLHRFPQSSTQNSPARRGLDALRPAERAMHAFVLRTKGQQAADEWWAKRVESKRRVRDIVRRRGVVEAAESITKRQEEPKG